MACGEQAIVWDLEVQFLLKGFAVLLFGCCNGSWPISELTENYQRVSFLSWILLPEDTGTEQALS